MTMVFNKLNTPKHSLNVLLDKINRMLKQENISEKQAKDLINEAIHQRIECNKIIKAIEERSSYRIINVEFSPEEKFPPIHNSKKKESYKEESKSYLKHAESPVKERSSSYLPLGNHLNKLESSKQDNNNIEKLLKPYTKAQQSSVLMCGKIANELQKVQNLPVGGYLAIDYNELIKAQKELIYLNNELTKLLDEMREIAKNKNQNESPSKFRNRIFDNNLNKMFNQKEHKAKEITQRINQLLDASKTYLDSKDKTYVIKSTNEKLITSTSASLKVALKTIVVKVTTEIKTKLSNLLKDLKTIKPQTTFIKNISDVLTSIESFNIGDSVLGGMERPELLQKRYALVMELFDFIEKSVVPENKPGKIIKEDVTKLKEAEQTLKYVTTRTKKEEQFVYYLAHYFKNKLVKEIIENSSKYTATDADIACQLATKIDKIYSDFAFSDEKISEIKS